MFSRAAALPRAFALPISQTLRTAPSSSSSSSSVIQQGIFRSVASRPITTIASSTPETQTPNAATSTPPPTTSSSPTQAVEQQSYTHPESKQPLPPTFNDPLKLSKSLYEQLPYLTSQRPHYVTAHLHDRPYLLTEGDQLRLPFLMPNVKTGDVLRLNRASVLGSREFTMRGAPYLDERMFECRVRVIGTESEPLRVKEKTKRRQRHVRRVKSKHRYTILKVMNVKVKTADELLEEGAVVVEDAEMIKKE
ncbi:hypothetical protein P170DRAFT_434378 [Aspergillus steynii IBT 23096]|uniref:Large ribosomal subunit protein bL21m n=1 Tax=Aspergillus steynii IBT 23096 TaxID=1392250 RepID=A0A2I2GIG0_9EURO|nr:uncharacterized protein P170DRAFT_434378 [Aspergillus steynii IBT 23096]PLB52660.1 hypothetical protein P170DRAFT_434378 [Aspergillus steynii IBT 23096]